MNVLLYAVMAGLFTAGFFVGFVSGHARGKMEAYEERLTDE